MEKLLGVKDIMERYHLKSRQTAVKRMKEMVTRLDVKPYLVPERSVLMWEKSKEVHPPEVVRAAMRMKRQGKEIVL